MLVIGDNRNNNNTVTVEKEDEKGVYYKCEFATTLAPYAEIEKDFYVPNVKAEVMHRKEKKILEGLLLNTLRTLLGNKKVIIGLGPGRCGTMSLSLLFAAQPAVISHHESNPKLRWESSVFEFMGKWADLFANLAFQLPIMSDVAFWYLPFVDYIKYVCPNTKFVCLRRGEEEIVQSFMLKYYDTSAWTDKSSEHWRTEWVRGNTFLDSFPSYDLPKEEGCRRYVKEYYEIAKTLEKRYSEDFKIFDIDCLNSEEGRLAILTHCGIDKSMMHTDTQFSTNKTTELHENLQRQWKDRFGEES